MGPNRWSQSRKAWVGGVVAWGILFGSPVSALPEWVLRPPGASGSTVWFVGQALDQTDLTNGRQRATDVAFDHLMTAVGVESASAMIASWGIGESYSQFSSVAEGQLAPSKWQVERYATPEGTRWNIWVLCGVPRGRFEELQATWRTTYKPKIELERLAQEAANQSLGARSSRVPFSPVVVPLDLQEQYAREGRKMRLDVSYSPAAARYPQFKGFAYLTDAEYAQYLKQQSLRDVQAGVFGLVVSVGLLGLSAYLTRGR